MNERHILSNQVVFVSYLPTNGSFKGRTPISDEAFVHGQKVLRERSVGQFRTSLSRDSPCSISLA